MKKDSFRLTADPGIFFKIVERNIGIPISIRTDNFCSGVDKNKGNKDSKLHFQGQVLCVFQV